MRHYCTCGIEYNKQGQNWHKKFREVKLDNEGLCIDCGYYTVKAKNPEDALCRTRPYRTKSGDNRGRHGKELTHYISQECCGLSSDLLKATRQSDYEGKSYIRGFGYN